MPLNVTLHAATFANLNPRTEARGGSGDRCLAVDLKIEGVASDTAIRELLGTPERFNAVQTLLRDGTIDSVALGRKWDSARVLIAPVGMADQGAAVTLQAAKLNKIEIGLDHAIGMRVQAHPTPEQFAMLSRLLVDQKIDVQAVDPQEELDLEGGEQGGEQGDEQGGDE